MMTIHLLHGIHTSKSSRRLADLAPIVERAAGRPVVYHEYGDIWGIQTRSKNPVIAEQLLHKIEAGDILVGHSNGCAIWLRALMLGAPARGLVLLNPALDDKTSFARCPNLEFIHLYYNDDDEAVPWAARSIHLLTDPLWGDMGRDGYKGSDYRLEQTDCERTPLLPVLRGHSAIITKPEANPWAEYWGGRLRR